MLVNLAFSQTIDELLLVTAEAVDSNDPLGIKHFSTREYPDENAFLECVIAAALTESETSEVIAAVLIAMQGSNAASWVGVDLSPEQLSQLGLDDRERRLDGQAPPQLAQDLLSALGRRGLEAVLLRSPTPVAVVVGEEYRIAFMNDAYAHILGQEHASALVGKALLDALPALRGQSCLESLNEVYRSGEPMIGVEVRRKFWPASEPIQEAYFELSYNPVKTHAGTVFGVMVLATNITEKVLDRQVSASRESQLYRQWAELETIYRTAPLAMCHFDAKEYRIIRANDIQAETMGARAEDLVGKGVLEIFPDMNGLREIFERVAAGEHINNLEFTTDFPSAPGIFRTWLLNYSPVFDAFGNVEMITSIALEITPNETGLRRPQSSR